MLVAVVVEVVDDVDECVVDVTPASLDGRPTVSI